MVSKKKKIRQLMSKSLKYIILIAILLVANFWLFFTDSFQSTSDRANYFDAQDMESVSMIQFVVKSDTVKLERSEQGWILNDTYKADEGFTNTLISVLNRVEVGRTIGNWDQPILGEAEIEIDFNGRYRFQFATNLNGTKSYFIKNGEAKGVAVPGYRDNVVDLFKLHVDQWRDRLVFDGSWRTIQKVTVAYADGSAPFEIKFDDKFFLLNGQTPQDSTAVIDYLNQFEYFQANELISDGRFPEFDSLMSTHPIAVITLDDIKSEEPTVLTIFPRLGNQRYHLMVKDGGQQMVVDANRVGGLLSRPE
jgi:hypothetical protein